MNKKIFVYLSDVREILLNELKDVNDKLDTSVKDEEEYNFLLGRRTELALLLEKIK